MPSVFKGFIKPTIRIILLCNKMIKDTYSWNIFDQCSNILLSWVNRNKSEPNQQRRPAEINRIE